MMSMVASKAFSPPIQRSVTWYAAPEESAKYVGHVVESAKVVGLEYYTSHAPVQEKYGCC